MRHRLVLAALLSVLSTAVLASTEDPRAYPKQCAKLDLEASPVRATSTSPRIPLRGPPARCGTRMTLRSAAIIRPEISLPLCEPPHIAALEQVPSINRREQQEQGMPSQMPMVPASQPKEPSCAHITLSRSSR